MNTCGVRGCAGIVTGGFQNVIGTGNFENPHAEILGLKLFWCEEHESSLIAHASRGYYLTADGLPVE
jgi:hypothetical protein